MCDLFLQIVFDVLYVLHIFCSGMGFKMREAFNKFFEMGSSSATAPPACLAKPGPLKWQMKRPETEKGEGGSYETIYLEDYDIIINYNHTVLSLLTSLLVAFNINVYHNNNL